MGDRILGTEGALPLHQQRGTAAVGLLIGIALYGLNFWIIAPSAFPWFHVFGGPITLVDHALFGALVGALYSQLRAAAN